MFSQVVIILTFLYATTDGALESCTGHDHVSMGFTTGIEYRCGGCQCMDSDMGGPKHVFMSCEPKLTNVTDAFEIEFPSSASGLLTICITSSAAHTIKQHFLPGNTVNVRRFILTHASTQTVDANAFQTHSQDLEYVDLSHNLIRDLDALLDSLIKLRALLTLKLSGNPLRVLSPKLASLTSLITLELSDTQLIHTSIARLSLPIGIQELDLSDNSFENVNFLNDQSILGVTKLILSSNSIEYFPKTVFDTFVQLEELKLNSNGLTDEVFVPGMFDHLNKLERFNLSANRIRTLQSDVFQAPLTAIIQNTPTTKAHHEFHVAGNQLVCDCLMDWIRHLKIRIAEPEKCSEPEDMRPYSIYAHPQLHWCLSVEAIVGLAVGSFIFVIIVIGITVYCTKRRRKRQRGKKLARPVSTNGNRRPTVSTIQTPVVETGKPLAEVPAFNHSSGHPGVYWQAVDDGEYYEVPRLKA